jgi:hypothetical protein
VCFLLRLQRNRNRDQQCNEIKEFFHCKICLQVEVMVVEQRWLINRLLPPLLNPFINGIFL